jgi:hypothetical protein
MNSSRSSAHRSLAELFDMLESQKTHWYYINPQGQKKKKLKQQLIITNWAPCL